MEVHRQSGHPWDQQITNCTNAIRSGKCSGAEIAPAYYNRGIAYHRGEGDLDRAIGDYDEAIRVDPSKAMYYNNMKAWPAPVIRLYFGQLTPEAVLAAADDANPRMKQQQVCEANYFTGELALQQGKADEANRLFALVAADCRKSLTAYAGATAELKVLGARP
jgi:tetratricopeptide (TPR) repeat protein